MNKLSRDERARILHLLCEDSSIWIENGKRKVPAQVAAAGKAAGWWLMRSPREL
jgi:hypothetical protein